MKSLIIGSLAAWIVLLGAVLSGRAVHADDPRTVGGSRSTNGTLLVAGGGTLPDDVYDRFVALAGGSEGRLVLIPTATTDDGWLAQAAEREAYIKDWKSEGIPSVVILHTRDRNQANEESVVQPLRQATAVWLGGGDQALLERAYLGTLVEKEIHGVLQRGGVVGGSSAGAAIQSRLMIRCGDVQPEIGTGFDLVPGAIIDQHFLRRNRVNRLIEAVRRHPNRMGLGVDEGTALLVKDGQVEVMGDSYVLVVTMECNGPQQQIRIRSLSSGDRVRLAELAGPLD